MITNKTARKWGLVIGVRLRDSRERLGLTQPELAERVGVSTNQIVKWEKNKAIPGSDYLLKIAKELDVSTDYLLGLVPDKKQHLSEAEISTKEQRILDAYRHGDWQRLLYELATDEMLKEKAIQEASKLADHPTSNK